MSKIEVDAIDKQSGSTLTLGGSGTAVTLACGATQTGFGRTGTVDWNTTPKTATFTAVSGDGFFANTSGSAFNMNLPAGSAGAIVSVADYAATWQTNALTVVPNGTDKIGSVNANVVLNTEGQSVTFIFVDSTQGWINTMDSTSNARAATFICASVSGSGNTLSTAPDCANAKIATFTGPGTFTVNSISNKSDNNVVSYMVVAGAGGGGGAPGGNVGAGGGAGGFREVKSPVTPYTASPLDGYPNTPNRITVTATGFPIAVGGGGAGGVGPTQSKGDSGGVSTFSTITSAGGGGGGAGAPSGPGKGIGVNGGSGGGGGGGTTAPNNAGGSGNTPPTSPPQGNNGSGARCSSAPSYDSGSGGGGGAGGAGGPTDGVTGGAGGAHINSSITASDVEYSGGAGGGTGRPEGSGAGTPGGGGAGTSASVPTAAGTAGTANTGGGGGGSRDATNGAAGGSGIVIIRYKFQ